MLALLRSGDHLVSSSWIYGGTRKLYTEDLVGMGIEVTLVNPLEPRAWRKALKKNTRAIFLESPVNPTCRVLELSSLQNLAHNEGIALVVDSTFASPVNFRPIEDGFGGMLGIEIKGAGPAAMRFAQALKLFAYAASLGGVDSLVIEPRYSSHEHMSSEERARIGIPDGFLRMSIGIENVEDLIADIEQALQQ